jgi:hypothetical protein
MHQQSFSNLGALSDAELVEGLYRVVGSGWRLLAELLAHLCEVEDRRLHLDAGYPSLFAYCVARLGFTEDEAYRRINVARLARRAPIVFTWIAEGRLSLSVAALLHPYVLAPHLQQLIEAVAGKSVKQAREALAALFPQPDVTASIRKLPQPKAQATLADSRPAQPLLPQTSAPRARPTQAAPPEAASPTITSSPPAPSPSTTNACALAPSSRAPRASLMQPLAPGRFRVQFTADAALKDKLELARDLLRHAVPSGDLAAVIGRALDLLVSDLKKRRFGAKYARKCSNTSATNPHTAITHRATRRAVCERDGFQCTWRGPDGTRCASRAWLEQDHQIPLALGGPTSVQNLRLLCKAHNQRAAELVFGRRHIERAIIKARARHRGAG